MLRICGTITCSPQKLHKGWVVHDTESVHRLCNSVKRGDVVYVVELIGMCLEQGQYLERACLRSCLLVEADPQTSTLHIPGR